MQVVECVNADALVVKTADGVQKKIHFSSLRPPRYCAKRSELACRFFDACNSRQGGGGGLLPKNWVGRAPSFPKWPKSIPYKWPKRLKHTIPCRATYTNILPIYVEMGTPPLPLGFLLKYSSICEVRSKLISDASSNMADIHVHCSTNDRNLLRWCL